MDKPATDINNKCRISPNVILLGIVSFLNDLSSEIIAPILPMLLKTLGGASLTIGLVGGLRDSVSSILQVLCGYWSDRTGKRKIFVWSGYFTSAIFKLLLSVSKSYQQATVFAGLERVGKGLRTAARDAIIAESSAKQRGKGFGIHRALDTSGAVLGSFTVFILYWSFHLDFMLIVFIAGLIAFSSLVVMRFVREPRKVPQQKRLKIGLTGLSKPLRRFMIISAIFSLANFSYMFFIIRAQQAFTERWSLAAPILLYVLFNIFYAAFSVPLGVLSDRIGRKKVILLGYMLFSLTCLGFAFLTSPAALAGLFCLYGVTYAALDANQRAYVSDLSQQQLRATALGTFHTVTGLLALPAGLIAGFVWQSMMPEIVFVYAGTLGFLSAFLLASCAK